MVEPFPSFLEEVTCCDFGETETRLIQRRNGLSCVAHNITEHHGESELPTPSPRLFPAFVSFLSRKFSRMSLH